MRKAGDGLTDQTVGEIGLDLVLNSKGFDKQLKGITNIAKKAGAALVAAFSVKKIIDFGKECINLGSDLEEVQNVVDVTFSHMSGKVDEFAKNAASSYGLSETMAKKFTGTFGAMAKSFGFSEDKAYEMSTALTGLAGDVASFYNISQDEAYTKLKCVFSGETETLKDLGIVMTQSALDAYALANGYGKTTQAMSELEKVSLRYAFVQNQLSAASGDFARTSGSWANQVRILSLQFDSLKATIGQGFINLFTPALKGINAVIGKLAVLANAFKAFTELITGKKASSGVSEMAATAEEGLGGAASAAQGLENSAAGVGKAAKKAAKEVKALMGFDQIQKMDEPSSDGSDSSGGSGSAGGSGDSGAGVVDFGGLAQGETIIGKTDKALAKLIQRAKELAGLFQKGFQIGFGDSGKNIIKIKTSLESIGKSLKDIFASKEVTQAAGKWADSVTLNLGKITGSAVSVGVAIVTNLTGGIAKSLEEKKGYIKEKLASLFTINAEMWNVKGDFIAALGDVISKALTSDAAIDISADICSILTTGVLSGAELFEKARLDLTKLLCQPFTDNKDKISEAIENTLKPLSNVIGTIKKAVEDAFVIIGKAYDEHVAPMFQALTKGGSDTFGKFLDAYNKYIAPVLSNLSVKFQEVYDQHLKPCMESIGKLIGTVADSVKDFYLVQVKPFVDWCIKTIMPKLAPVFEWIGETVLAAFGSVADAVGAVVKVFDGIITFLTGIYTGNWKKAFEGHKKIVQGFRDWIKSTIDGIKGIFGAFNNFAKKIAKPIADGILKTCGKTWKGIQSTFNGIGAWFGQKKDAVVSAFSNLPANLREKFSETWKRIQEVFSNLKNWFIGKKNAVLSAFNSLPAGMKAKFKDAWNRITSVFSGIGSWFGKKKTAVVSAFSKLPGDLKDKFKDAWNRITSVFSGIGDWFSKKKTEVISAFSKLPGDLKAKFSEAWTAVKNTFSGVGTFFDGVWSTIKGKFSSIGTMVGDAIGGAFKSVINGVLRTVENTINKGIGFINSAIGAINKLPGVKIGTIGRVDLPQLAEGGYVKKNTPQLAVIGDNRHQGEVVAPEDKLEEMAEKAVRAAGGGNNAEIVALLRKLISLVEDGGDIILRLGDQDVARANQRGSMKLKRKYVTTKTVFE